MLAKKILAPSSEKNRYTAQPSAPPSPQSTVVFTNFMSNLLTGDMVSGLATFARALLSAAAIALGELLRLPAALGEQLGRIVRRGGAQAAGQVVEAFNALDIQRGRGPFMDYDTLLSGCCEVARELLRHGAEIQRAEDTMRRLLAAYNRHIGALPQAVSPH